MKVFTFFCYTFSKTQLKKCQTLDFYLGRDYNLSIDIRRKIMRYDQGAKNKNPLQTLVLGVSCDECYGF